MVGDSGRPVESCRGRCLTVLTGRSINCPGFWGILTFTCLLTVNTFADSASIAEITVVSVRDSTGIFENTRSIDQIDPSTRTGLSGIATLIDTIPGVSINGQGGSLQTYSVRGMSRARIQTRFAGVPLYTERRAGNAASFVDPFLIDSVSVVKGPSSTLFGSGAMGGLVSLEPRRFESLGFMTSYYSNGDQVMSGLGWGNELLSVGVAVRDHGRSEDTHGNKLNDAMRRYSAIVTGNYETGSVTIEGVLVAAQGKDIGKSSTDYPSVRVTDYPDEDHLLASISIRGSDWFLQGYAHDNELVTEVSRTDRLNVTNGEGFDYGFNLARNWQQNSLTTRLGLDWGKRSDVEVRETVFDLQGANQFVALDGDQEIAAIYLDTQWQSAATLVHLGVRYSYVDQSGLGASDSDKEWTGSLFVRQTLNNHVEIFGQLGSSFRYPELTEKFFFGTTGRGVVSGNSGLTPETSVGLEFGTSIEFDRWKFGLSAFYTGIEDYIERVETGDQLLSYRNLKDGDIVGVEFSAHLNLDERTRLYLGGQWLDGEDDSDGHLQDLTPPGLLLHLTRSTKWGGVEIEYERRFEFDDVHSSELPLNSFDLFSATATVELNEQLNLTFWARNITDESYRLTSDRLSTGSTGRGFGVSLKWHTD